MSEKIVFEIKQNTKMKTIIEKCDEIVGKCDFDQIIFIGESKGVNKTISISQILLNKYSQLTQTTNLGISEKIKNEPKLTIIVTKKKTE